MSVGSSACVFMNWLHTEEGGLARVRLAAFHLPGFVWVCREVTGVESLRSLAAGRGPGGGPGSLSVLHLPPVSGTVPGFSSRLHLGAALCT